MSATLRAEPTTATDSTELQPIPAGLMLERTAVSRSPAETVKGRRAKLDLLARLEELDLYIYPENIVNAHKERMLALLQRHYRRQWQALAVLAGIAAVTYAVAALIGLSPKLVQSLWIIPFFLTWGTLVHRSWSNETKWGSCSLDAYRERHDLPEAVDAIVGNIQNHSPRVRFWVDYLKTDPALYAEQACNTDQAAYVCVAMWEKPGLDEPLLGLPGSPLTQ